MDEVRGNIYMNTGAKKITLHFMGFACRSPKRVTKEKGLVGFIQQAVTDFPLIFSSTIFGSITVH